MWTRRRTITLVVALAAAVVAGLVIRCVRVPVRRFATQPLLSRESPVDITPDATVTRMIRRAEWDYWFFPIDGFGHHLVFLRAWTVPPNDIYLSFWTPDISDTTVRYRCSLEDHGLLWKAV